MSRRPVLLVVEDDKVLRDSYRAWLSLSNFAVHACEDGLEALHYLDHSRPDVIVLDLDLPRIPGTVLYDEIRARPRAERVPIVIVSGLSHIPELPGAVVLRKPVTPDQLVRVIDSTLARRDRDCLYVRKSDAVLVARVAHPGPNARLHVLGPGPARAVYEYTNLVDCLTQQTHIERALVAEGYQLLVGERRGGRHRRVSPRLGSERRRDLTEFDS